jgi:hypothetical protein
MTCATTTETLPGTPSYEGVTCPGGTETDMRTGSGPRTVVLVVVPLSETGTPSGVSAGGRPSSCSLFDVRVGHRADPYRIVDLYPFSLDISGGRLHISGGRLRGIVARRPGSWRIRDGRGSSSTVARSGVCVPG